MQTEGVTLCEPAGKFEWVLHTLKIFGLFPLRDSL